MTTYPFKLESNGIIVPCSVKGPQGIASLDMIIDTAATLTVLPINLLMKVGIDVNEKTSIAWIETANGLVPRPVVRIPKMAVLGTLLSDVEAVGINFAPTGLRRRGLLGLNVLKRFDFCVRNSCEELEFNRLY